MGNNKGERTIKEVADTLGVSIKTIKIWEKKGLVPLARKNKWGWRIYSEEELQRLKETVIKNNYFRGGEVSI